MYFVAPYKQFFSAVAVVFVICAVVAGRAVAAPAPSPDKSKLLSAWIQQTAKPKKFSKAKLPPKIKRAVPKIAKQAEKLYARALTAKWSKAGTKKKKPSKKAVTSAAGKVVETLNLNGGTVNLGNGVMLTARLEGRAYEDESKEIKMVFETTSGRDLVRFVPAMEIGDMLPEVDCPTAEGLLTIQHSETVGGTTLIFRDKKLKRAVTDKAIATTSSEGHVGRDALLNDVSAKVKVVTMHYETGLQSEITTSADVTIPREGEASIGPRTASTRIKAAGASAAQEAEVEKVVSEGAAKDARIAEAMTAPVSSHRSRMLQDEYKWYQVPNYCAKIEISPESVDKLEHGAAKTVSAVVKASKTGGEAASQFTVTAVARGSFDPTKPQGDPGSPAQFTATGAAKDSNPTTVDADVFATSTAGRAEGGWLAEAGGKKVDLVFTGSANYTRDEADDLGQIEHHVQADYSWTVTYKNVDIDAGGPHINFASATDSSFSGTWSDDGRFGAAGPGSYQCLGALKHFNPELAMLNVTPNSGSYTFSAMPFFTIISDPENSGCTGLGSPPNAIYNTTGSAMASRAINTISAAELSSGTVIKAAVPGAAVPANCSDVVQHEDDCTQQLTWTGTITVKPAAG